MRSSANNKGAVRRLADRLFREEQWGVGLITPDAFWRAVDRGGLIDADVRWLEIPRSGFLADPCWLSEPDGLFVAERLQYRRRTGRIVLCKVQGNTVDVVRELDLPAGHYSYPMVYRFDNQTFIIPECAEHQRICRIEIDDAGRVIDESIMVERHELVDPTLFEAGGKFWLFSNPLRNWDHQLVILSAPTIGGPWSEARFSPMSIANCRGAGRPIRRDGTLFWPTQHNSERYGGGLIIRRIDDITDDNLSHAHVATVLPDPDGRYPLGTHTVAEGRDHYLIDGARRIFRPTRPIDVLISRARRRRARR